MRLPDDIFDDIESIVDRYPDAFGMSEQTLADIQARDFDFLWVFGNPVPLQIPIARTGARRIWETRI